MVENDTNLTDVKAIHYNGFIKPWVDNSSIALDHFPHNCILSFM